MHALLPEAKLIYLKVNQMGTNMHTDHTSVNNSFNMKKIYIFDCFFLTILVKINSIRKRRKSVLGKKIASSPAGNRTPVS